MTVEPAPVLGVDPGHDGGAVLLGADGRSLMLAVSWRRRQRAAGTVYVTRHVYARSGGGRQEGSEDLATLHDVGCRILRLRACAYVLVVEGISLHRKASPATAIELGRTVGLLTGPLLGEASAILPSPLASVWRPAVLGLAPSASSDDSERAARLACIGSDWGYWLGPLLDDGHVAEARCIARWGWVQARGAAQLELVGGRRR